MSIAAVLAGCGDGPRAEDDTLTGTSGATNPTSVTDPTGDDSSSTTGPDGSTGPMADASSSSGGPTIEPCETVDCDGVCCAEAEECVLQACLPACDSGVRCGDDLTVCCPGGDVCLGNECVTPGDDCLDSYDCPEGQFCETTLDPKSPGGQCLTQPDDLTCEILPDFEDIELSLEWSWEEEASISIPIVADVDGDDEPEIIVNTTFFDENGNGNSNENGERHITGIVVVFDGTTGEEQFRVENSPQGCASDEVCDSYGSYGRSTLGVADVDGNDLPDIIYTGRPLPNPFLNMSYVFAYNGVGQSLWRSSEPIRIRAGAPAFANFDDDPESEIIYGATIIDNDGTVVWNQDGDGGQFGRPPNFDPGAIALAADLNGDDYPEIVTGRHAWSVDWVEGAGAPTVMVTQLWDAGGDDGFPAVADLDQNGTPEVILMAGGQVRVLDGATGALWCGVDPDGSDCEGNELARTQPLPFPQIIVDVEEDVGGPPTVADFDGDGRPEFAAAGAGGYVVFDLNREGEDIVQPDGQLPPGPGDIYVRWFAETQDATSRSTGSSVFDFQGDGVAEVLYADECFMRVYNGATGEVIAEEMNSSGTIHEYPIVVDADGDGNSEILVVANDNNAEERCESFPDYQGRRGIFMYGDPNDSWVRTRRVWNTHNYHVTNSDSRGLTPAQEQNNWEVEGLNNYRQNFQGEGVFNAPDLAVDLQVNFENCLDEAFEIQAIVRNEGALGIPSGVDVTLYAGTDNTGMVVGTEQTEVALLPGAFTTVSWLVGAPGGDPLEFYVEVDADDEDPVLECDEEDNTGTTATVSCPPVG